MTVVTEEMWNVQMGPALRTGADPFVLPPRSGAPRLHDTLIELCRRSGFQPAARAGGWQTAWELDALPELGLVSLGPESLSRGAPGDVVALPLVDTDERLETAIVTRAGETSPLVEAFAEAARRSGVTGPDGRSGSVLAFPRSRATARGDDGLLALGRAR